MRTIIIFNWIFLATFLMFAVRHLESVPGLHEKQVERRVWLTQGRAPETSSDM